MESSNPQVDIDVEANQKDFDVISPQLLQDVIIYVQEQGKKAKFQNVNKQSRQWFIKNVVDQAHMTKDESRITWDLFDAVFWLRREHYDLTHIKDSLEIYLAEKIKPARVVVIMPFLMAAIEYAEKEMAVEKTIPLIVLLQAKFVAKNKIKQFAYLETEAGRMIYIKNVNAAFKEDLKRIEAKGEAIKKQIEKTKEEGKISPQLDEAKRKWNSENKSLHEDYETFLRSNELLTKVPQEQLERVMNYKEAIETVSNQQVVLSMYRMNQTQLSFMSNMMNGMKVINAKEVHVVRDPIVSQCFNLVYLELWAELSLKTKAVAHFFCNAEQHQYSLRKDMDLVCIQPRIVKLKNKMQTVTDLNISLDRFDVIIFDIALETQHFSKISHLNPNTRIFSIELFREPTAGKLFQGELVVETEDDEYIVFSPRTANRRVSRHIYEGEFEYYGMKWEKRLVSQTYGLFVFEYIHLSDIPLQPGPSQFKPMSLFQALHDMNYYGPIQFDFQNKDCKLTYAAGQNYRIDTAKSWFNKIQFVISGQKVTIPKQLVRDSLLSAAYAPRTPQNLTRFITTIKGKIREYDLAQQNPHLVVSLLVQLCFFYTIEDEKQIIQTAVDDTKNEVASHTKAMALMPSAKSWVMPAILATISIGAFIRGIFTTRAQETKLCLAASAMALVGLMSHYQTKKRVKVTQPMSFLRIIRFLESMRNSHTASEIRGFRNRIIAGIVANTFVLVCGWHAYWDTMAREDLTTFGMIFNTTSAMYSLGVASMLVDTGIKVVGMCNEAAREQDEVETASKRANAIPPASFITALIQVSNYGYNRFWNFVNYGKQLRILSTQAVAPIKPIDPNCRLYIDLDAKSEDSHRSVAAVFGTAFDALKPRFFLNRPSNLEIGLRNRLMFRSTVNFDLDTFNTSKTFLHFKETYVRFTNHLTDSIPHFDVMEFNEWTKPFPKSKADKYTDGFETRHTFAATKYKPFVKFEPHFKLNKHEISPRIVVEMPPQVAATCGPFVKSLSKVIYGENRVVKFENFTIVPTYGSEPLVLGAILTEQLDDYQSHVRDYEVFELDYSSFDGSVTYPILLEEMKWYRRILDKFTILGKEEIFKALCTQLKVRFSIGGVKGEITGRRLSGVNNTTVGNTILNSALMIAYFAQEKEACRILFFVAGDDNLLFAPPGKFNKDKFMAFVSDLGFTAKVKQTNLNDAEICSSRLRKVWYEGQEQYIMTPKPGKILAKFGVSNHLEFDPQQQRAYLRGIVLGLRVSCFPSPLLSTLFDRVLQLTSKVDLNNKKQKIAFNLGMKEKYDYFDSTNFNFQSLSRNIYAKEEEALFYGMSDNDYNRIIEELSAITFPFILNAQKYQNIIEKDLGINLDEAKDMHSGWYFTVFRNVTLNKFHAAHVCLIAPIYEELLKRIHWSIPIGIGIFETLAYQSPLSLPFHVLTGLMPLHYGIAVHIAWNTMTAILDPDEYYQPMMSYRYGKWCGAGWSAGKKQESVIDPTVRPIDKVDELCQEHDAEWYRNKTIKHKKLSEIDLKFAKRNFAIGTPRAILQGVAVGSAGLARKVGLLPEWQYEQLSKDDKPHKTEKPEVRVFPSPSTMETNKVSNRSRRKVKSKKKPRRKSKNSQPADRRRKQLARLFKEPGILGAQSEIRRVAAPVASGFQHRFRPTLTHTETGMVYFPVPVSSGTVAPTPGAIFYSATIGPDFFGNSRVGLFFRVYDMYEITAFVEYEAAVPTTQPGNITAAAEFDVADPPPASAQQLIETDGTGEGPVWSSWKTKPFKSRKDLYCTNVDNTNATQRQTNAFRYHVGTMTGLTANTVFGNLILHYKIKFKKPVNETAVVSGVSLQVQGTWSTSSAFTSTVGINPDGWTTISANHFADHSLTPGTYSVVFASTSGATSSSSTSPQPIQFSMTGASNVSFTNGSWTQTTGQWPCVAVQGSFRILQTGTPITLLFTAGVGASPSQNMSFSLIVFKTGPPQQTNPLEEKVAELEKALAKLIKSSKEEVEDDHYQEVVILQKKPSMSGTRTPINNNNS